VPCPDGGATSHAVPLPSGPPPRVEQALSADGRHGGPRLGSALPVIGEDIVSRLDDRVAPESTLGVVPLRRLVGRGGGPELAGRGLIFERGPSPPPTV